MHAKVHLLFARSCRLPGHAICLGAIVWMIKLKIKWNAQEYSTYSVMLKFVLVPT